MDKKDIIEIFNEASRLWSNDKINSDDIQREWDNFEPDDYTDDVAVDDVVYALENKEIEITDEDLAEDVIKRQMRDIIQGNYPKASLD